MVEVLLADIVEAVKRAVFWPIIEAGYGLKTIRYDFFWFFTFLFSQLVFFSFSRVGQVVIVKAQVSHAFSTSMEVSINFEPSKKKNLTRARVCVCVSV